MGLLLPAPCLGPQVRVPPVPGCAAIGGTRVWEYFVCMSVCIITSKHPAGLAGQQNKRYVNNCYPGDTGGSQSWQLRDLEVQAS